MFGHKKPKTEEVERPERLHYTKYYEHDGALRAYANRAMVLACSMSLLALPVSGFCHIRAHAAANHHSRHRRW